MKAETTKPSAFAIPNWPMEMPGREFMLTAARVQAQAAKAVLRYQIEMLDFVRHRCEQDIKLVDDLVKGDALDDAFDVYSSFLQQAASDYTDEAGKVAAIGSKLAAESAKEARTAARTVIEDAAAATAA
jgi:hypothetical protein